MQRRYVWMLVLAGLVMSVGCASSGDSSSVVRLDSGVIGTAQNAKDVFEARVYVHKDGTVRKLAVYHKDASAVPAAVKATAKEKFPSAEVVSYEAEWYEDLGTVYEVELKTAKGEEVEVSALPDGSLVYVERKVPFDSVDPAMVAAVKKADAGATLIEAEVKEGPNVYVFALKAKGSDGRTHYFAFDRNKKLVRHSLRVPGWMDVALP